MAKINVYYVISAVGIVALIIYLWLAYLPLFAGSDEYAGMTNWTIIISLMLAAAMVVNLILAKKHP